MTGSDGVPVRDSVTGEMWTHKLEPGALLRLGFTAKRAAHLER
jgi:hypothetical protein